MASSVLLAVFFVFSILFGIFGIGGGVVYIPAQLYAGIGFNEAATTTLFLIMVSSFSSTWVYIREGLADWKMAFMFMSLTFLGSFLGGWSSHLLSEEFLTASFIGFLFINGIMLAAMKPLLDQCVTPGRYFWRRQCAGESYCVNMPLAVPVSIVAGILSGLIGVGGGLFLIPLMIMFLGIPVRIAIATSAFIVAVTGLGGFAGRIIHFHVDWMFAITAGVLVVIGAGLGARLSKKVRGGSLKKWLGWFFVAIAVFMFIERFVVR